MKNIIGVLLIYVRFLEYQDAVIINGLVEKKQKKNWKIMN